MTEKPLLNSILLQISALKCRLFRNNVGTGWVGTIVNKHPMSTGHFVTLREARPLHAGLHKGSADLIGWTTVVVTPEMVGKEVAIFTAIEVKAGKTKTRKEQGNFLDRVKLAGGISGIARTPDDAVAILKGEK